MSIYPYAIISTIRAINTSVAIVDVISVREAIVLIVGCLTNKIQLFKKIIPNDICFLEE